MVKSRIIRNALRTYTEEQKAKEKKRKAEYYAEHKEEILARQRENPGWKKTRDENYALNHEPPKMWTRHFSVDRATIKNRKNTH